MEIRIPGRHNVLNSLAAVAVAHELEIPWPAVQAGLHDMTGVQRRFQIKGEAGGVLVLDDYGHHPTEIRAVLETLANCYPDRRRIIAFQPHRYTRTQALLEQFSTVLLSLRRAAHIRDLRGERKTHTGVNGRLLVEEIAAHGHHDLHFCPTLEEMSDKLLSIVQPGDVVMTLGAGNILQVGEALLQNSGPERK